MCAIILPAGRAQQSAGLRVPARALAGSLPTVAAHPHRRACTASSRGCAVDSWAGPACASACWARLPSTRSLQACERQIALNFYLAHLTQSRRPAAANCRGRHEPRIALHNVARTSAAGPATAAASLAVLRVTRAPPAPVGASLPCPCALPAAAAALPCPCALPAAAASLPCRCAPSACGAPPTPAGRVLRRLPTGAPAGRISPPCFLAQL